MYKRQQFKSSNRLFGSSIKKMLKIIFLFSVWFDIILCEMQSKTTTSQVSSCKNPPLCHLSDKTYKAELRSISLLPYSNSQDYARFHRSYYNGGTSASPAYYHAFDPISVLASLAFLAFLLQSFASLFERSRSILPTIVSGRQSVVDLTIPEIPKYVPHAMREYENFNEYVDTSK